MKGKTDVIGQPMDRVDGKLKVTGGARYAAEFWEPKLAYAVLIQSTIGYGTIKKFDTTAAEKSPGVLAVITPDNLPAQLKPPENRSRKTLGLLDNAIYFSGQHIGVVVAETLEAAQAGAELVKIDYAAETAKVDMASEMGNAQGLGGNPRAKQGRGDFATGYAAAAHKLEASYYTPIEHHNPMEPHATVAVWKGDELTVYDSTQGVSNTANNLAHHFGLDGSKVRVVDPFVGGGFGCKGMPWPHTVLAATAAKVVNRPVKLALTRREMFTSNGHRPQTKQDLMLGTDANGKLVALDHSMHGSTSILDTFLEGTGGFANMIYSCPNVSITHKLVRLNIGSPTYMRAPGESTGSYSIECAMDELAHELGVDPLELRLRNYAETDESRNEPWSSKSLRECYAEGAKAFGWNKRTAAPRSMREGSMLVGYGMATASYPANYWGASAKAVVNADGTVLIQCGTQDLGTGTYTILTQIAAEELGVPAQKVRVEIGDSSLPPAPGSGGSTSATSAGSAVQEAARGLKKDAMALGGLPEGHQGPVAYGDILKKAGKSSLEHVTTVGRESNQGHSCHGFGAQFCEVHVDPDFGTIRVARWVGAFGLGKVLNAKTLNSQLQGGIVWGIGMALMEETIPDDANARFVNMSLADYHVPVNSDVPPIQVIVVPEEDKFVSPLGAKGAGEIGITGAAAAIANAVFHATGKRVRELPITFDKLL